MGSACLLSLTQTCPAGVGGEVMGVGSLQALLHLLKEIFDLILDLLLESCANLRRREQSVSWKKTHKISRERRREDWEPRLQTRAA